MVLRGGAHLTGRGAEPRAALMPALDYFVFATWPGLPFRGVAAKSSSWLSDIDSYISREAPLRAPTFSSPRLAASAAPAAFCWAFDFAGNFQCSHFVCLGKKRALFEVCSPKGRN